MKFILLVLSITLFQVRAEAQAGKLTCLLGQTKTALTTTVDRGEVISLEGQTFMTGHQWISLDGIKSKSAKSGSNQVGKLHKVLFRIDTSRQRTRTKIYKFVYKRPWEEKIETACLLKVRLR